MRRTAAWSEEGRDRCDEPCAIQAGAPMDGVPARQIDNGYNFPKLWQMGADMVVKVASGIPVAELPIEFPTSFELAINATTARLLGVNISYEMKLRTDRFITGLPRYTLKPSVGYHRAPDHAIVSCGSSEYTMASCALP